MSTIVSLNMMRDDKILKMDSTSPLRKRSATFEIFDGHFLLPQFDLSIITLA